MKKFIICFAFILSGCASITLFSDNENCILTNEFKVLQASDKGALAYECTFSEGCSVWNQIVFLEKQLNVDYYDGMIVKSPKGKCAVRDGVYTYINREEIRKTVPVIRFEYKNPPKTEEEIHERVIEFEEIMNDNCLSDYRAMNETEDKKFCKCYAEEAKNALIERYTSEKPFDGDEFNKNIKKKCGKLPQFMEA